MAGILYKKIIKEIEHQIEQGILTEGDKLPSERKLAKQYEVSRNVVREAIKVLSEKGLVVVKYGKGAYVTTPSNDILTDNLENLMQKYDVNIEDIIEVREELESMIMRKAIENATPDNIEELKQINNEMGKFDHQVNIFVELDYKFHMSLAKATQNKIFFVLSNSFFELSNSSLIDVTILIDDIEDRKKVLAEHRMLVEAIEEKNIDKALKTIKQHIASSSDHMLKKISVSKVVDSGIN